MKRLLMLFVVVLVMETVAADVDMDMTEQDAMNMLKKYKYMGDGPDSMNFTDALMMFQEVAHINQTGELDEKTMEMMHASRCGLPDIMDNRDLMKRRRKRFVVQGSKWTGGMAGYNYVSYPTTGNLAKTDVEETVDKAFMAWQNEAKLDFTKRTGASDIQISFVKRDHGDDYPLDGPGGTLAHAFFPLRNFPIAGHMHFDDEEIWGIKNSNSGVTDLYYVALHELGHSLGLSHSMYKDAVMYPYYPGYKPNLKLTGDDIKGIQTIYGPRQSPNTPAPPVYPTEATTATRKQQFCITGSVDAIGTLGGMVYAFQGAMYAELDDNGIKTGFPRLISDDWESLPSDVNAALAWEKYDMLLLFKGEEYWRYELDANSKPKLKYGPRRTKLDFTGDLPAEVQGAFVWADNNRIYLISDQKYYRIRNGERVYSDRIHAKCDHWYYRYPKSFSKKWNVYLGPGVYEGMSYHGRTFFFTKTEYVRYNDNQYKVDAGYPKSVAGPWFGCGANPPGSLEMEMDMMQKESQFEELNSMLMDDSGDDSGAGLVLPHLSVCLVLLLGFLL